MVKICAKCLEVWPGGFQCDTCGGPLTLTSDAEAKELPEVVWRNQRVDYGARRGMIFRFMGMFIAIVVGLFGVRSAVPLPSPWSWIGAAAAIAVAIGVWRFFHVAANRGVRIWVLRKGQVQKRKLARALLGSAVRR